MFNPLLRPFACSVSSVRIQKLSVIFNQFSKSEFFQICLIKVFCKFRMYVQIVYCPSWWDLFCGSSVLNWIRLLNFQHFVTDILNILISISWRYFRNLVDDICGKAQAKRKKQNKNSFFHLFPSCFNKQNVWKLVNIFVSNEKHFCWTNHFLFDFLVSSSVSRPSQEIWFKDLEKSIDFTRKSKTCTQNLKRYYVQK